VQPHQSTTTKAMGKKRKETTTRTNTSTATTKTTTTKTINHSTKKQEDPFRQKNRSKHKHEDPASTHSLYRGQTKPTDGSDSYFKKKKNWSVFDQPITNCHQMWNKPPTNTSKE